MAARRYLPPATFVAPTGTWPEGPFGVDTPTYALVSARIAIRLKTVMTEQGLSLRAVAGPAAMDPTSLSRLLTGKVVPDLGTIAGLENTLDTDLWPGRL
ncbi:MAG: helix-turn-helix transcriptional regulator [Candidatus Nanopelagicales bacterium]|mgnify:FL=1